MANEKEYLAWLEYCKWLEEKYGRKEEPIYIPTFEYDENELPF